MGSAINIYNTDKREPRVFLFSLKISYGGTEQRNCLGSHVFGKARKAYEVES